MAETLTLEATAPAATTNKGDDARKLRSSVEDLEKNSRTLKNSVDAFDKDLVTTRDRLEIPLDLAADLQTLSTTLENTSDLLEVVSIVPAISSEARALKRQVDTIAGPVASASATAQKFAKIIRPLRDDVAKLEVRVSQLDKGLGDSINTEDRIDQDLNQTLTCIGSLPDGSVKDGLLTRLDSVCAPPQPIVAKAATLVGKVNGELTALENDLKAAKDDLSRLADVRKAVDAVINMLRPLIAPLQAIADALERHITIPYGPPYPHCMCKGFLGIRYPCDWRAPDFTFSIEQIVKGLNNIAAPLEKLFDAAADAILKPLLDALHLNITLPQIPGLDQLDKELNALEVSLEDLKKNIAQFFADLDAFETSILGLANIIAPIEAVLNSCRSSR